MKKIIQPKMAVILLLALFFTTLSQSPLAKTLFDNSKLINKAASINPPRYSPGRLLITFRPGTTEMDIKSIHALAGSKLIKQIGPQGKGVDLISVPSDKLQEKIALYKANPNVLYAEPDYIRTVNPKPPTIISGSSAKTVAGNSVQTSNDLFTAEQWALENNGLGSLYIPVGIADSDIDADGGWQKFAGVCGSDGASCTPSQVAVIDTGVHCESYSVGDIFLAAHPDLSNCSIAWPASGYYLSDVDECGSIGCAQNMYDEHGHGTHVAGIIGAVRNNSKGISGVSNADIVSYKVCNADGLCPSSAILAAIYDATNDGIDVINMSLGGPDSSTTEAAAIATATGQGIVVIAAAGNDYRHDYCLYPANYDGVLSVGATDFNDLHAGFSNFGNCVDIVAPGDQIISTFPAAGCLVNLLPITYDPDCYAIFSGTSQATPHASGAAAMIKAAYPSLTRTDIETILKNSTDKSSALLGLPLNIPFSQNGRLNLDRAMAQAALTVPSPPPPVNDPNNMYVFNIAMSKSGNPSKPTLNVTVNIRRDSNANGVAESTDAAVSGASLNVKLCSSASTVCNFTGTTNTTDANGDAKYKLLSASGTYTFTVLGVTHNTYTYKSSLNVMTSNSIP